MMNMFKKAIFLGGKTEDSPTTSYLVSFKIALIQLFTDLLLRGNKEKVLCWGAATEDGKRHSLAGGPEEESMGSSSEIE